MSSGSVCISNSQHKCMTAKEVQQEYLDMDIKKLRVFLNQYCSYKKIGNTYFYPRSEIENLLLDHKTTEYKVKVY
ncbi:hypothetical protein C824_004848 [Schaedlerella arabinosiphila]|nr:hypothetical protein C824_004848 [Schaedlerella arabinosiphila]